MSPYCTGDGSNKKSQPLNPLTFTNFASLTSDIWSSRNAGATRNSVANCLRRRR